MRNLIISVFLVLLSFVYEGYSQSKFEYKVGLSFAKWSLYSLNSSKNPSNPYYQDIAIQNNPVVPGIMVDYKLTSRLSINSGFMFEYFYFTFNQTQFPLNRNTTGWMHNQISYWNGEIPLLLGYDLLKSKNQQNILWFSLGPSIVLSYLNGAGYNDHFEANSYNLDWQSPDFPETPEIFLTVRAEINFRHNFNKYGGVEFGISYMPPISTFSGLTYNIVLNDEAYNGYLKPQVGGIALNARYIFGKNPGYLVNSTNKPKEVVKQNKVRIKADISFLNWKIEALNTSKNPANHYYTNVQADNRGLIPGIAVDYNVKSRFFLSSGLYFERINFLFEQDQFPQNPNVQANAQHIFTYWNWELPVLASYKILESKNKRSSVSLAAGPTLVLSEINADSIYTGTFNSLDNSNLTIETKNPGIAESPKLHIGARIDLNFTHLFKKHGGLELGVSYLPSLNVFTGTEYDMVLNGYSYNSYVMPKASAFGINLRYIFGENVNKAIGTEE